MCFIAKSKVIESFLNIFLVFTCLKLFIINQVKIDKLHAVYELTSFYFVLYA